MAKASFVLPAYKVTFLAKAIDSILSQSFRDFELIIVNDASPYNIRGIVDSFCDDRISYFENEKNIGGHDLVGNWELCIERAQSEYIILASDDDFYEPQYLEKMMMLAQKHNDVNLFHCRIRYINENGDVLQISQPAIELESQVDFVYQRLVWQRKQAMQEFMFRKEAFVEIGGFVNFPMAWYSDDATWNLLARRGVAYSDEVLFNFRMSGQNISSTNCHGEEKIEAMLQYAHWMDLFLPTISADSADEVFLKRRMMEVYKSIIFSHFNIYGPTLPFHKFVKVAIKLHKLSVVSLRMLFSLIAFNYTPLSKNK